MPVTRLGFPIFNDYLVGRDDAAHTKPTFTEVPTVFIRLSGKYRDDRRQANFWRNRLSLITLNMRAQRGEPSGYMWHHHEVMGVMQLVNKRVHSGFRLFDNGKGHYGGTQFWLATENKPGSYGGMI